MKKHNIIPLLFVLSLLGTCGCANDGQTQEPLQTAEWASEDLESENKMDTEASKKDVSEEPEDDSIVWVMNNENLAARLEKPLNELLTEKGYSFEVSIRGIFVDPFAEDGMGYYDKITERKEKGLPTDLIYFPETQEEDKDYYAAVKDGLLTPLPADGDEDVLREALTEGAWESVKIDGQPYGLCGLPEYFSFGIGYNRYYLQKYGIDTDGLSGDIEDIEAVLLAFAKQEEEGALPLAYWGLTEDELGYRYLFPSCAAGFLSTNGEEIVNVFAEEKTREYLEALKKLRDQELISFLNIDGFDAVEEENGFFAIASHKSTSEPTEIQMSSFLDKNQNPLTTDIWYVPGNTGAAGFSALRRGVITGIASWSAHTEDAYEFLKLLYTDADVANLVKFGEEGVDYQVSDGQIAEVLKEEINPWLNGDYTNDLLTYPMEQEPADKRENWEAYDNKYGVHPLTGFQFDASAVVEEIHATNAIIRNSGTEAADYTPEFKKLMSADVPDVTEALDALNEKLEAAGISKIIAEANRQVQEWKQKKE